MAIRWKLKFAGGNKKLDNMNLMDLVERAAVPQPWSEGEKIPWHEAGFSERMLKEHLSQDHDLATRRFEIVDKHVEWIHRELLGQMPTKILDLGCGPGFYSNRLAKLGHQCVGIDHSPASIAYATDCAKREQLSCVYQEADIRQVEFGSGFGIAMVIFGEFNVFRPATAKAILQKAYAAINPGAVLLLEVHTFAVIQEMPDKGSSWYSAKEGLFSDQPHVCLTESFWDSGSNTTTQRFFIIDASTGGVTRHAQTMQAYSDDQCRALLDECGFCDIEFHPAMGQEKEVRQDGLFVIVAKKGAA